MTTAGSAAAGDFRMSGAVRVAAGLGAVALIVAVVYLVSRSGDPPPAELREQGAATDCSRAWTSSSLPQACDGRSIELRVTERADETHGSSSEKKKTSPASHVHVQGNPPDALLSVDPHATPAPLRVSMCGAGSFTLSADSKGGVPYLVTYGDRHSALAPSDPRSASAACAGASTGSSAWKIEQGQLWSANDTHQGYAVRRSGSSLVGAQSSGGASVDVQWRAAAAPA